MSPLVVSREPPIDVPRLDARLFSPDGRRIVDLRGLLAAVGPADFDGLVARLPALRRGGVQSRAAGAIQDPAGSAIGGGTPLQGGGASGAIYAKLRDLEAIPAMRPGEAVFNSSPGPGRRVLHSFSPRLGGDPSDAAAREVVVGALATAYLNALAAFDAHRLELGDEGHVLNLVPLSASIYAGEFAARFGSVGHLDPSYTLATIMIAMAVAAERGIGVHAMTLSYFDEVVLEAAKGLVEGLAAAR